MSNRTAFEGLFTKRTGNASNPHEAFVADTRVSPSGMYPINPGGGPTALALRVFAQFDLLKANLLPGARDEFGHGAAFAGWLFRNHAEAIAAGGYGFAKNTLTLTLTVPASGLRRGNITITHVPA